MHTSCLPLHLNLKVLVPACRASEWVSCWETIKRANNVYDSLLRSGRNKFLILLWAIKCNMWKSTKRLIKFRFSWPSGVSDSTPSESKPTMGNVWLFSFSASPLHSLIGFHKSSDTRAIQGNGKSRRDLDECHNFLQFTGYLLISYSSKLQIN